MTKITWKAGTMLSPLPPAMISCGTVEKPNVMTVAWTGIISSEPAMTYVSIRPSRYSHELIQESGEFVINLTTLDLVNAADYCGVKSGRDINKFAEMNLTAEACSQISAPQIKESPLSLECKVKSVTNYGTHDMFLAEIVAVNVDDKYIDEDGKLWLEKAGLVAFSHGNYYTLGRNLGKFGFSVEKKAKPEPKCTLKIEEESNEEAQPKREFRNERPARNDSGDRRNGGDRGRPSRDGNGGDRRSSGRSEGGYNRRPRQDGESSGERRPYSPRPSRDGDNGGERRPYSPRPRRDGESSGERRPYSPRPSRDGDNGGERRPYSPRPRRDGESSGERRPYSPRPSRDGDNGGERRPYSPRPRRDGEGSGERRPYSPRPSRDGDNGGERKPYSPRPSRDGGNDRRSSGPRKDSRGSSNDRRGGSSERRSSGPRR